MKLDWKATPLETKKTAWSAFVVMLVVFIAYQVIDTFFYYLTDEYVVGEWDADQGKMVYADDIPGWANALDAVRHAMSIGYGLFILFVMIRTRGHIRAKYEIPEQSCTGCEYCCCTLWCSACTLCQMASHTGKVLLSFSSLCVLYFTFC
jgi:hypothetical protein